jgi:hypothetical protein
VASSTELHFDPALPPWQERLQMTLGRLMQDPQIQMKLQGHTSQQPAAEAAEKAQSGIRGVGNSISNGFRRLFGR